MAQPVQRSTAMTSTDFPWSEGVDSRKLNALADLVLHVALTSSPDHPLTDGVVVGVAAGISTATTLIQGHPPPQDERDLRVLVVEKVGHRDNLVTVGVSDTARAEAGRVIGT